MPLNDADDALRQHLATLSRLEPPPGAVEDAIKAARTAVLRRGESAPSTWRKIMRVALPSGIAACLIAAAIVGWVNYGTPKASAAEQLEGALQATQAYKGWMHLTANVPASAPRPRGAPPPPTRITFHYNTVDGSMAQVREYPAGSDVLLHSMRNKEMFNFSAATGELRINTMADLTADSIRRNPSPTTVAEMLSQYKKQIGRDPISLKESQEGELTRFDVTLFASAAEAEAFSKEHPGMMRVTGITLWTNKERLITRMKYDDPVNGLDATITYGPPEIHDVYDLGVPKTAKVLDQRLKADLATLLARLNAHSIRGDYVALETIYDLDAQGQPSATSGYATLYAAQGNRFLTNEYRLLDNNSARGPRPGTVFGELPDKWPTPDVEALLPKLLTAIPIRFIIMSGDHGWAGDYDTRTRTYMFTRNIDPKERPILLLSAALNFWPNQAKTGIGFPNTEAAILPADAEHAGLVGLRYENKPVEPADGNVTGATTTWLDPARDDLPVQSRSTSTDRGQSVPSVIMEKRYTEFAKLPEGQWFPTRWREIRTTRIRAGEETTDTSEHRLQIVPALKLSDDWFTDPRPRVAAQTTQPAGR